MADQPELIFGDDEPEDAWHPDDSIDEQLADLTRRAALLDPTTIGSAGDPAATLDALAGVVARARHRDLTDHDRERVAELAADIAYVRGRL